MKAGIIGTGNIGGTIARKLKGAGHDVRVANSRGLEGVRAFANEIGASAVDTRGAVEGVELIVISIPFPAVAELPKDLFDAVPQAAPVIDTGNYYPGCATHISRRLMQGCRIPSGYRSSSAAR